jgi:FtsH-binding integral membrane protein
MFGAMSVYGTVTKRDLTEWRSFLMMGLIGLIVAGLVNLFIGSERANIVISIIGVIVFIGLTAYNTQRLRLMASELADDDNLRGSFAVLGALSLYLDFVNIFLYLLRIFGKRR